MQATNAVFYIVIVIMSVVIHEVSHGFVAEMFGDNTARKAGRLTLNPLKHLDLFGSVLLPIVLYFSAGFVFGWAKPVPYNPRNLRNQKWGTVWVAAAGILANFLIALVFSVIIRLSYSNGILSENFVFITSTIVLINLVLGVFNLIPLPPLDGSKILFSLLPKAFDPVMIFLERYSLIFIFLFIIFFSNILEPVLGYLYHILTGLSF